MVLYHSSFSDRSMKDSEVTTTLPLGHLRSRVVLSVVTLLAVWCWCAFTIASAYVPGSLQQAPNLTYRLRKVDVTGADHIKIERIVKACKTRDDSSFSPASLSECETRIKNLYAEYGYIRVRVEVQPVYLPASYGSKEGFADIRVTITEGPKYYVYRIEVIGNERTGHRVVERAAGIRLGEPYNPAKIEKWVRGLNQLGRFEVIKKEDIDIQINDQDQTVYVLFRVKEKLGPFNFRF